MDSEDGLQTGLVKMLKLRSDSSTQCCVLGSAVEMGSWAEKGRRARRETYLTHTQYGSVSRATATIRR